MTFGTLVANALRDTTTMLGATVIAELSNVLEALRPRLDEDEKARALLGRFFTSIASPELAEQAASWAGAHVPDSALVEGLEILSVNADEGAGLLFALRAYYVLISVPDHPSLMPFDTSRRSSMRRV